MKASESVHILRGNVSRTGSALPAVDGDALEFRLRVQRLTANQAGPDVADDAVSVRGLPVAPSALTLPGLSAGDGTDIIDMIFGWQEEMYANALSWTVFEKLNHSPSKRLRAGTMAMRILLHLDATTSAAADPESNSLLLATLRLTPAGSLVTSPGIGVSHRVYDSVRKLGFQYSIELVTQRLPQQADVDALKVSLARLYVEDAPRSYLLPLATRSLGAGPVYLFLSWHVELSDGWSVDTSVSTDVPSLAGTSARIALHDHGGSFLGSLVSWLTGAPPTTADLPLSAPLEFAFLEKPHAGPPPRLHIDAFVEEADGLTRQLLGTHSIPLSTTAGAHSLRIALHRPQIPPNAQLLEHVFGTPTLPAPRRALAPPGPPIGASPWPTALAGTVALDLHVAWQAPSATHSHAPVGGMARDFSEVQDAGLAHHVHDAVLRARARLALIRSDRAASATPAGGLGGGLGSGWG
ncbi:hypothetical protein H9P43_005805 [Blastocladiella emersonii ATCC 22665]|nr:hypothetical protein H9P43_005805 [Blastocladiella emersonii ATCC 22665]